MGTSIIELQRQIILENIRAISADDWKVLVLDERSRKLVTNVTKEDDILNANIINIENLEDRRQTQSTTDAIYLLSPLPHVVEALKADLNRKRYRKGFLVWTSHLPRPLHDEIFRSESRQRLVADSRSMDIDYYPRESHMVTFREPWSFHALFHPACDTLVKNHLDSLTAKIVSVCVSLGEYPIVKYFRPKKPRHEASVLCSHLASFVQGALDNYAGAHRDRFPPPSTRPRGYLFITDRSMDLMAPLVHELTYQAMAMDVLPVQDDDEKVTYRNTIKRGQPDQEEKDIELNEGDKLWVEHRHMHMKDLLVQLSEAFKRFQAKNPQFADNDGAKVSVNTIKDMLAGLPEFQEGKEAFSLHIDMAERCAKLFQDHKLLDLTSVEQSLATGMDEDNKKPRNLADQLVRLLDDDSIVHEDRLRLLIMYVVYRNGILGGDIEKLRCHGQLSPMDGEILYNLEMLGARTQRQLKDESPIPPPLFPPRMSNNVGLEEVSLSRFEPALRYMLEEQCQGTLDPALFPPVKPHLDAQNPAGAMSQTSLRNAGKPTWASSRAQSNKPRQRLIVFMAGGATYSEARACYEVSHQFGKDVILATTHMQTPKTYLRQVSLLSAGRKQLNLPQDRARPQMPAWMSDKPPEELAPKPPQHSQSAQHSQGHLPSRPQPGANGRPPDGRVPPTEAMSKMSLGSQSSGGAPRPNNVPAKQIPKSTFQPPEESSGKLKKEKKEKHGLFHRKDKK
ncbi:Protein transport protein sec1 [Cyphellophora attinorum]|uniref:Protein transport protein sec1 n=1 Tax=Cyphellophora attinorum TaxID=1664694 RepID=A0A0N0NIB2_9EURO|nr:Protein transport protein sec1 [Phialophora attinorum]KPI35538.1 Protein transport protein sec1 [Phialophora attinorum]